MNIFSDDNKIKKYILYFSAQSEKLGLQLKKVEDELEESREEQENLVMKRMEQEEKLELMESELQNLKLEHEKYQDLLKVMYINFIIII